MKNAPKGVRESESTGCNSEKSEEFVIFELGKQSEFSYNIQPNETRKCEYSEEKRREEEIHNLNTLS